MNKNDYLLILEKIDNTNKKIDAIVKHMEEKEELRLSPIIDKLESLDKNINKYNEDSKKSIDDLHKRMDNIDNYIDSHISDSVKKAIGGKIGSLVFGVTSGALVSLFLLLISKLIGG